MKKQTPQLNNIPLLKDRRRRLRNNLTTAEATLWKYLKSSQQEGRKFRRQHSFGMFILDFYCPGENLAVELDGAHHFTEEGKKYDEKRSRFLNDHGIQVVRFENHEVLEDIERVLGEIRKRFHKPPSF